ncbi:MAG: hypothetical protein Q7K55_05330 [Candidatus Levybacteria bacterium]|nr:hypothetical protein [Candidatus Levybacteria bacterium]
MNKVLIFDFQDEDNKRYGDKTISITRASAFAFHQGFYSEHQIHKFTHVILGYNKNEKAIALRFIEVKNPDKKPNGAKAISPERHDTTALSFFKKNNINVSNHAGRYKVHIQNEAKQGRLFYILLDEKDKIED